MKITFAKFFLVFRIMVLVALAAILGFLVFEKLAFGGVIYATDFRVPANFILGFYPDGRREQLAESQKINFEPVYLEVYASRKFNRAQIQLRYKNAAHLPARFGPKIKGGDWSFFLVDLVGASDDFVEQSFEFDLRNAERKNNKIKFMLASPAVNDSVEKIYVDKFRITYVQ